MFRGKGMARIERVTAVLRKIADEHGKAPSQVALRWLLQQPGVLPIPGAKTGEQAATNAGALTFTLADDELRTLAEATG